jgi:hypothetical protein
VLINNEFENREHEKRKRRERETEREQELGKTANRDIIASLTCITSRIIGVGLNITKAIGV